MLSRDFTSLLNSSIILWDVVTSAERNELKQQVEEYAVFLQQELRNYSIEEGS